MYNTLFLWENSLEIEEGIFMDIGEYKAKKDKTIDEHRQELMNEWNRMKAMGYVREEHLYQLVKLACFHHDDGKANKEFQMRIQSEKKRLFNEEKEVPHNILSAYSISLKEMEQMGYSKEDYYRVVFAVMYHHNYGKPLEIIQEKRELIKDLLQGITDNKIKKSTLGKMSAMMEDDMAIKIKGFLHKCDYSASGNYQVEYANNFLEESLENVKKKWKEKNPNSDWNDMQTFCMEKRDENIIVIAQTGKGKTEGGLQWIGNNKGFFVLPLRTAINAIYDRIKQQMITDNSIDEKVAILHSESLEYYNEHFSNGELDIFDYEKRGKHLTMPLSISTMDQLFDFVFKYHGYELKLVTLSYSKIVIDEIQMYHPTLLRYLIYGLKRITQMGGNVAIMTATLSPFLKQLLQENILFKEENIKIFVDDSIRHNVCVKDCKINITDILEVYEANERKGKSNKILVICNTIGKAQELYKQLKQTGQNININLLHSRYTREDRRRKEHEIIQFGVTYNREHQLDCQSGIWISTSLVEASLDIDFDYLFTELQDLNSLFQRFGRCNRKGEKDCSQYNCYVYTEIDKRNLITFYERNNSDNQSGFIDNTIFQLSKQAIKDGEGKLSEWKKLELINNYLTMENLKESNYYKEYCDADWIEDVRPYHYENTEHKLRDILSETIIPSPVFEMNKSYIMDKVELLKSNTLSNTETLKVKDDIMKFTVNIPLWHWNNYEKAVKRGVAQAYQNVELSAREKIKVMECNYDEIGYERMNYQDRQ